jgi:hypothetical protein
MGNTSVPFVATNGACQIGNLNRYWGIATATWLYKNLFLEIPESLNKITMTFLDLKI